MVRRVAIDLGTNLKPMLKLSAVIRDLSIWLSVRLASIKQPSGFRNPTSSVSEPDELIAIGKCSGRG